MVSIKRLTLRLPAGCQHRAANIAHLVGEGLAQLRLDSSRAGKHYVIPPVRVGLNASDCATAQAVIREIVNRLEMNL